MAANPNLQLFRLADDALHAEYVAALAKPLKAFLLAKGEGHCQRVDYLPRAVMAGLGQRLSGDPDLIKQRIAVRVVTDRGAVEPWEVSGSGAVKLREDATYGLVRVFCALFPTGIRLAEEDSLNIATFKTDDAVSFDAETILERHLNGQVNLLPPDQKQVLTKVLTDASVRRRPVRQRLRYVLSVLGQSQASARPVDWEQAGAFLYELGLVPDFGLSERTLAQQLARNDRCVCILTDAERSLGQNVTQLTEEAELADEVRRRELSVYLADQPVLKTARWLPPICHDPVLRDRLSFETWGFAQPVSGLKVILKPLKDPKSGKVAAGLQDKAGALTNDGKRPISISWTVSPAKHEDLGRFRISVVRKTADQGEIDVITPKVVAATRKSFKVPIEENSLGEDEQCVAVIRIQALTQKGLPFEDAQDESEPFWIEQGEEIEETPQERGTRVRHLDEIQFLSLYASGRRYEVRSQGWDLKREFIYSVRLTNNRRGDLVLNPLLLELERRILADPGSLGLFAADLTNRRRGQTEDFKECKPSAVVTREANAFFKARETFFSAVRDLADGRGVVEIADLHALRQETLAYVERYLELLRLVKDRIAHANTPSSVNTNLSDLADVLRIDSLHLILGPQGRTMEVVLLAPTHPLRVLWLFQYQTLLRDWMRQMEGMDPADIRAGLDEEVLDKLTSLNVPNTLAWTKGRAFVNTDNLGLYWGIYPDGELPDLRSAVNAALLGVGAETAAGEISTVTPRQIADKILRYLAHHPYVQTLKINVINPGDGRLLLEAIKQLLSKDLYADFNFDLKFFAPQGTPHQLVGSAFDEFMSQKTREDWTFGPPLSEVDERLLSPNDNPLFPKLIYGKYTTTDLREGDPQRFNAHLTFVIDYFSTTLSVRPYQGTSGSSALYNLLAEYVTDYQAGKTTAAWSRMIAPIRCPDLTSDGNTARLHETHDLLAHTAASLFGWGNALDDYLTVQLELTDQHGKHHLTMLDRVHEISDWVLTIDRNFGIEYFDDPIQGPGSAAGGYLIDYTPEFLDGVAHRLIISTYHQQEVESILRNGFFELLDIDVDTQGESIDTAKIAYVLALLKSVSGRLALKLINNPAQASEVIGLALTRLALEQDGRLKGRVLVPIDSHLGLFYLDRAELENADLTLKRTDLLLVELRDRAMHIDLIEVKNRKATSPAALIELHEQIRAKNINTEKHFRRNFIGGDGGRLDAAIKYKELANILRFYFDRSLRYGLFDEASSADTVREGFRRGLDAVAAGVCEVSFGHEGFIFNGSSYQCVEVKTIHENRIATYGRAGISKLLGIGVDDKPEDSDDEPTDRNPTDDDTGPGHVLGSLSVAPIETTCNTVAVGTTPGASSESVAPGDKTLPPVADQMNIDKPIGSAVNVFLGRNLVTGADVLWDPSAVEPRRLLNQHLLIVGKSGSGKSETTKSLLYELDRQGIPSIIFDFQGEYASGEFADVVNPQVFDVMEGLPINPFEIPIDPRTNKRRRPVEMIFRLADTLNAVFAGSGDIQLGKLREAIQECYVQCGFKIMEPAPDDKEPPTLEMLEAVLDQWSGQGGQIKNLQVRLQPLFMSGIFNQGKASFSFEDLFKRTTVILLTAGIKDLMLAASRFLLEKIYGTMMINGLSKSLRVMVCVDEAHKLCNDPKITDLAKESRKYGLGLILSSQETRDFHPSIFANAGTQIVLALEDADATIMAKVYATDKKDQGLVKNLIVGQDSGVALIRSTHFQPYTQALILSFEDRVRS